MINLENINVLNLLPEHTIIINGDYDELMVMIINDEK